MKFKNKVLKEIRNKGTAFLLACAVISSATGPVMAAVAHAVLTKDESQVTSSIIGNTTGKFVFALANSASSNYQVEAVLYTGTNSANMTVQKRQNKAIGDSGYVNVSVDMTDSVAKVTAYGNTQTSPRTGCIATARIEGK